MTGLWQRLSDHLERMHGGRQHFSPPKGGKERAVPLPEAVGLRMAAHLAAYPPVDVTLPWKARVVRR